MLKSSAKDWNKLWWLIPVWLAHMARTEGQMLADNSDIFDVWFARLFIVAAIALAAILLLAFDKHRKSKIKKGGTKE